LTHVFNQCPKCSVDLPDGATSCTCGWRKRGTARLERARRVPIPCAHDGCEYESMLSLRLRTGWANLCRAHYEHHIQLGADKFNRELSLDTREKRRAFIMEKLGAMGARGLALRVPGQDDEERAVA